MGPIVQTVDDVFRIARDQAARLRAGTMDRRTWGAVAFAHLAICGCQDLVIGPALSVQLLNTALPDLSKHPLRFPYDAFFLNTSGVDDRMIGVAVSFDDEEGTALVELVVRGQPPETIGTLGVDGSWVNLGRYEGVDVPQKAVDMMIHLIANACLYLSSGLEVEVGKPDPVDLSRLGPKKRKRAERRMAAERTITYLAPSIERDARRDDGGERGSVRRHWVRGHWRCIQSGVTWVRPHLRGGAEDDAVSQRRTYVTAGDRP